MSCNTNNFYGNVSNIQLQQGNVNSIQTQTVTAVETLDFDRVSEFITKIKKYDSLFIVAQLSRQKSEIFIMN